MKRLLVFTLGLAAAFTVVTLAVLLVPAGLRERAMPPPQPIPATPIAPSSGQDTGQPVFIRKLREAHSKSLELKKKR